MATSTKEYIVLKPLDVNELPPHEALGNTSSTTTLQPMVSAILTQGLSFMDEKLGGFKRKELAAQSSPSLAQVEVLTLDNRDETWFARRSKHANGATQGSASWGEFDGVLRVQHSKHEMDYTPDVLDAFQVCQWSTAGLELDGWKNVTCEVYEMLHKLPFPLQPRSFSVLVLTASSTKLVQSLIAQIPVDLHSAPGARYANGSNQKAESLSSDQKKQTVLGQYISLERVRHDDVSGYDQSGVGSILWEMATASDAKGNLPMGVQKMGVPGAVVKDVGLVIDFLDKQRSKSTS